MYLYKLLCFYLKSELFWPLLLETKNNLFYMGGLYSVIYFIILSPYYYDDDFAYWTQPLEL